jgi:hypothetical protein
MIVHDPMSPESAAASAEIQALPMNQSRPMFLSISSPKKALCPRISALFHVEHMAGGEGEYGIHALLSSFKQYLEATNLKTPANSV